MADQDYTGQFNTPLDPQAEQEFMQWLQGSGRSGDLYDYDMRGAFKEGLHKSGGHLPDKYKKPNHPTFSNESLYSNVVMPGGEWTKNGNAWMFRASPFNVQMHGPQSLQEYFQRVEAGNALVLPQ